MAGRPRFGRELTEDVIPLEAGLLDRAIDQEKGCYTGQEVIVRILHRGHVNRHLRRLEFSGQAPAPGTELFDEASKICEAEIDMEAERLKKQRARNKTPETNWGDFYQKEDELRLSKKKLMLK